MGGGQLEGIEERKGKEQLKVSIWKDLGEISLEREAKKCVCVCVCVCVHARQTWRMAAWLCVDGNNQENGQNAAGETGGIAGCVPESARATECRAQVGDVVLGICVAGRGREMDSEDGR